MLIRVTRNCWDADMEKDRRLTRVSQNLDYGDQARASHKFAAYEAAEEAKSPREAEQDTDEGGAGGDGAARA